MLSTELETNPVSSCGKTYLESCHPRITPSVASLLDLPAKMSRSSRQGVNGRTLVLCLAPKEQSRGASSMPNISEWPNAAVVCSLSQVLETGSIPPRFFLSSKACAGILRRSEKRGKKLPEPLLRALQAVASGYLTFSSEISPTLRSGVNQTGGDRPPGTDVDTADSLVATWWDGGQVSQTLDAVLSKGQCMPEKNRFPAVLQPVSFHPTQDPISNTDGTTHAMGCGSSTGQASIVVLYSRFRVRRLMPVECERLQGFPDGHTLIKVGKTVSKDAPRYKALGNSMAVPVMRWIGKRVFDAMQRDTLI